MTDYTTRDPERIDALLTIEEVAELLRMPVASLRYWRVLGSGSPTSTWTPGVIHPAVQWPEK